MAVKAIGVAPAAAFFALSSPGGAPGAAGADGAAAAAAAGAESPGTLSRAPERKENGHLKTRRRGCFPKDAAAPKAKAAKTEGEAAASAQAATSEGAVSPPKEKAAKTKAEGAPARSASVAELPAALMRSLDQTAAETRGTKRGKLQKQTR